MSLLPSSPPPSTSISPGADHPLRSLPRPARFAVKALSLVLRRAYHLLYYPFAFTYDLVAWLVSGGEWADWRRAVIPLLPGGPVLEIAHGTGTLALDLADHGIPVIAFDLSPRMIRIAAGKIRRRLSYLLSKGCPSPRLFRGNSSAIPLQAESFACAVSTFPAEFIFQPETAGEIRRILRPGGIWIIVPSAYPAWLARRFDGYDYRETGFIRFLESQNFSVTVQIVRRPRSRVVVVLARRGEAVAG